MNFQDEIKKLGGLDENGNIITNPTMMNNYGKNPPPDAEYQDKSFNNYKFVKPYSATITVGGIVGITNKSFKVGDVFEGFQQPNKNISIRIAPAPTGFLKDVNKIHNSASYQEFLEVPFDYLAVTNDSVTNSSSKLTPEQQSLSDLQKKINSYTPTQTQQSFLEKHKTHLLILGGVVLIYLVYKKNKK